MATIERDEKGRVTRITFVRPDDWHLHVRDGGMLRAVLPYTVREFARAIIMPNLKPPVRTLDDALRYRERILVALPPGVGFEPLMTLYLTDDTSCDEIERAWKSGLVRGMKLYPAGATTNSDSGVTDIRAMYSRFERMERLGMSLLVHGEVTDGDIFDREAKFLDRVLRKIIKEFSGLKIVLEHVTTEQGVDFVKGSGPNIVGTITAHHLHINRNDLLVGGIRPHNFCLPIAKREEHRYALIKAVTSGYPCFFLGTDSAPHARNTKEAACGCAGCFTAPSAIELYLRAFEKADALENFEQFASFNGPDFYGLPRNTRQVTYERVNSPWHLPEKIVYGDSAGEEIVPFTLEEGLYWRLVE